MKLHGESPILSISIHLRGPQPKWNLKTLWIFLGFLTFWGGLVRVLALFLDEMKQIKSELGNVRDVSGKHTEDVLGMRFIPAEETLEATIRSLVAKGIVKV